jgi:hypothetical protein
VKFCQPGQLANNLFLMIWNAAAMLVNTARQRLMHALRLHVSIVTFQYMLCMRWARDCQHTTYHKTPTNQ